MITINEKTVVAENVEVDMETLRIARDIARQLLHKRHEAALTIVEAVVDALYPEDRKRLEAYERKENPCLVEEE